MKERNPQISISEIDSEWLKKFEPDDMVGYIAGDIGAIDKHEVADIWFVSKDCFSTRYTIVDDRRKNMTFGEAVELIKQGKLVAREGWNGKGMFIFLVPGSHFKVNRPPLLGIYPEGKEIDYHAHIDMKTAQGYIVPWLASQADVLAEDWIEVKEPQS